MTSIPPELRRLPQPEQPDVLAMQDPDEFIVRKGNLLSVDNPKYGLRQSALRVVRGLPETYDYEALAGAIRTMEVRGDAVPDMLREIADVGKRVTDARQARQFVGAPTVASYHMLNTLTAGAMPELAQAPGVPAAVARVVGEALAYGTVGLSSYSLLGRLGQFKPVAALAQHVPHIIRVGIQGALAGGMTDVIRPEGIPEEVSAVDVPGWVAKQLEGTLGERGALFVGGMVLGGAFDATLMPIFKGIQTMKVNRIAEAIPDSEAGRIRDLLAAAGVPIESTASKQQIVRSLLANQGNIELTERIAGIVASEHAMGEYVAQLLVKDPNFSERLDRIVSRLGTVESVKRAKGVVGPQGFETRATAEIARTQAERMATPESTRQLLLERAHSIVGGRDEFDILTQVRKQEVISEAASDMSKELRAGGTVLPIGEQAAAIESVARRIVKGESIKQDAMRVAAVFMAHPRGMSIVHGITNPEAIDAAARTLGVNLVGRAHGGAVVVMRGVPRLAEVRPNAGLERITNKFRNIINRGQKSTKSQPIISVFPDGTAVHGGYINEEMAKAFKVRSPVVDGVPRPDVGLRERLRVATLEFDQSGNLVIRVPSGVTNDQLRHISVAVSRRNPESVIIVPPGAKAQQIALSKPLSLQVEDAILASLPGVKKPAIPADMLVKAQQFAAHGMFNGQAAVTADGMLVEVQRYIKGEKMVLVKDRFTGEAFKVHEEQLGLLPHALDGDLTPNYLVFESLSDGEKRMYADLLRGLRKGLDKPITTSRQLERLANIRGYTVNPMGKGKWRIVDPESGNYIDVDGIKTAGKALRQLDGPVPRLEPDEIDELLGGYTNAGVMGHGGPHVGLSERVPLGPFDFDGKQAARLLEAGGGVGMAQKHLTPTRQLMMDLERKYGLPFGRLFLSVHEGVTNRQNFMSHWMTGHGPGPAGLERPRDVLPLVRIRKMAGRSANGEAITAWMEAESDVVARAAIEQGMSSKEIAAAKELRKWYDALFDTFGIERQYLTDYAPHLRKWVDEYGNDLREIWTHTRGSAIPKSVDAFFDYARTGLLDIRELDAWKLASQYMNVGTNNRFLATAYDEARELLWRLPDHPARVAVFEWMDSLRGTEFEAQMDAMRISIERLLEFVGVPLHQTSRIGDRIALNILGMGYMATMGFRPGLAIRNMTQTLQTTWTMFGGHGAGDELGEAMMRAMTTAGRDEAIAAGAISMKHGGAYAAEELYQNMVRPLKPVSKAAMFLYENADRWNRAVAYHYVKIRSLKALDKYAKATAGASQATIQKARQTLMRESGLMAFDKPVQNEFYRRLLTSPNSAAEWLGRNAADVTQWLYGRGHQVWALRTVLGRFLGQYGTWPLWYLDFVKRTYRNISLNGGTREGLRFLGRLGIANGAMMVVPTTLLGIHLGKWAGINSLFFSGGPGAEVMGGIGTMLRGAQSSIFDPEDPFGKSRLTEGAHILSRVARAYVPGYYGVRDLSRILNPRTPRDAMAAFLSTETTQEMQLEDKMSALTDFFRLPSDMELEVDRPGQLNAAEMADRVRRLGETGALRRAPRPTGAPGMQTQPPTPGGGPPTTQVAPPVIPQQPQRQRFPGEPEPINY